MLSLCFVQRFFTSLGRCPEIDWLDMMKFCRALHLEQSSWEAQWSCLSMWIPSEAHLYFFQPNTSQSSDMVIPLQHLQSLAFPGIIPKRRMGTTTTCQQHQSKPNYRNISLSILVVHFDPHPIASARFTAAGGCISKDSFSIWATPRWVTFWSRIFGSHLVQKTGMVDMIWLTLASLASLAVGWTTTSI